LEFAVESTVFEIKVRVFICPSKTFPAKVVMSYSDNVRELLSLFTHEIISDSCRVAADPIAFVRGQAEAISIVKFYENSLDGLPENKAKDIEFPDIGRLAGGIVNKKTRQNEKDQHKKKRPLHLGKILFHFSQ
jgi:hypothetical protein